MSENIKNFSRPPTPDALPDPVEHPDPDRLDAYHAGKLSAEEDLEIQEHLAVCGQCTEWLLDVHRFTAPLAPEEAGLSEFERAAGWRQLRARLDQDGFFTRGRRPRSRVAAVAAIFLLAVLGLSIYTLTRRPEPWSTHTLEPLDSHRGAPSEVEEVKPPVKLVLVSPAETSFPEYRAEIRGVEGPAVKNFSGLRQNLAFEVELKLDRGVLPQGEYQLDLLGLRDGRAEKVATYGFRIPKPR